MWSFRAAHEVHMLTMLFTAFLLPRVTSFLGAMALPILIASRSPSPFLREGEIRGRGGGPKFLPLTPGAIGVPGSAKDGPGSVSPGFATQARGPRRSRTTAPSFASEGLAARPCDSKGKSQR